jgi:hypothetical protein
VKNFRPVAQQNSALVLLMVLNRAVQSFLVVWRLLNITMTVSL